MADVNSSPAANGGSSIDTIKGNALAAVDSVANGPVAQNVKNESAKTATEFNNLAASRQTPSKPAATGQPLTHYHSFFSELLSWNNPRASAIAYASIVTFIFAVRYLDVLRWGLKLSWMVLGITVAAEAAGKMVLNNGLATQFRPRRYYTIPRETLDAMIGDVHELINFFVIEAQRILFAENVPVSAATAVAAFLAYYLVKIVPYWGLALLGTTTLFGSTLVYKNFHEVIDGTLQQASDVVNAQTAQLKDVASKHTAQATEITKQYMGDYTAKAQEMLGRGRSASPEARVKSAPAPAEKEIKVTDFPAAPVEKTTAIDAEFPAAPKADIKTEEEPLLAKGEAETLI